MGRIAILGLFEYEYEYRDAEYEYEKKHEQSIEPKCSIDSFLNCVKSPLRIRSMRVVIRQKSSHGDNRCKPGSLYSAESTSGAETRCRWRLLLPRSNLLAAVPSALTSKVATSSSRLLRDPNLTSPDINGITKLAISSERFQLIDSVFYLHAPDGFGRSKLAAGAERKLGVPLTVRNYTTIHNLSEMLGAD